MQLFHAIDDALAITYSKGVFRQVAVYRRGGYLYVKHGNGYAKLRGEGRTSVPDLSVIEYELPAAYRVTEDAPRCAVEIAP